MTDHSRVTDFMALVELTCELAEDHVEPGSPLHQQVLALRDHASAIKSQAIREKNS